MKKITMVAAFIVSAITTASAQTKAEFTAKIDSANKCMIYSDNQGKTVAKSKFCQGDTVLFEMPIGIINEIVINQIALRKLSHRKFTFEYQGDTAAGEHFNWMLEAFLTRKGNGHEK